MGKHPTNDPTNPLHRLASDLDEGVQYPKGVAQDVDFALARIAELEAELAAAETALRGLIRECRIADAHGARTGDESCWDMAFRNLVMAEKPARARQGGPDHG